MTSFATGSVFSLNTQKTISAACSFA